MASEVEEQRQRARAAREALVGKTIAGKYELQSLLGHADIATTHVAVGATMFALGVALSAICLRLWRKSDVARSSRHSSVSVEIPVS